jgi:hypothetical protein
MQKLTKTIHNIMNKLILSAITAAVVFAPLSAFAGQVQNRINNQEKRIYNGVKNGSLTPGEYRKLENRGDAIERQRNRYVKSGGKFTAAEKHHVNKRLNKQSTAIYKQKHD